MRCPQTSPPPLAQEPQAQAHCMTVGNQITSHFFAQQMGRSHTPYPCRPDHGHPPQNQRISLLHVTDHSSGHAEEWESLTPTRRATPKRGKTLPGAPGALTYSHGVDGGRPVWQSRPRSADRRQRKDMHCFFCHHTHMTGLCMLPAVGFTGAWHRRHKQRCRQDPTHTARDSP